MKYFYLAAFIVSGILNVAVCIYILRRKKNSDKIKKFDDLALLPAAMLIFCTVMSLRLTGFWFVLSLSTSASMLAVAVFCLVWDIIICKKENKTYAQESDKDVLKVGSKQKKICLRLSMFSVFIPMLIQLITMIIHF